MKLGRLLSVLMVVALPGHAAPESPDTYAALVKGMKCSQESQGHMNCDYRVGHSLHFEIRDVGEELCTINFLASSFEGDYWGSYGLPFGCVVVKPGMVFKGPGAFDFAFVSPRSGKVYKDWQSCQRGK